MSQKERKEQLPERKKNDDRTPAKSQPDRFREGGTGGRETATDNPLNVSDTLNPPPRRDK